MPTPGIYALGKIVREINVFFVMLQTIHVTFLPKGVKVKEGFEILHGIFNHKKLRFWVKQILWDHPAPRGVDILGFFSGKKQKVLRIV
jgi:hypothetical protein